MPSDETVRNLLWRSGECDVRDEDSVSSSHVAGGFEIPLEEDGAIKEEYERVDEKWQAIVTNAVWSEKEITFFDKRIRGMSVLERTEDGIGVMSRASDCNSSWEAMIRIGSISGQASRRVGRSRASLDSSARTKRL